MELGNDQVRHGSRLSDIFFDGFWRSWEDIFWAIPYSIEAEESNFGVINGDGGDV